MTLIALGTEPRFGDSAPSNMLNIVTPQARVFSLAPGDGLSRNTTSPKRPRFDIKTWVVARTNESITISWDNVAGGWLRVAANYHRLRKKSVSPENQPKRIEIQICAKINLFPLRSYYYSRQPLFQLMTGITIFHDSITVHDSTMCLFTGTH